jgi:hypothetical protein
MRLIANRQLTGDYGTVVTDQEFDTSDEIAQQLMRNGMAHRKQPPTIEYETKVIHPEEAPEVSPREPFRDSIVPHEKPPAMAPESAPSISAADVPERGDAHPGRRRGRPRSGS